MKNRRPSEQIKRTATVDRKPSIAKVSGEVIDLTMDSDDDEDEEERERRNVRPLLLLKTSKSCYEGEEAEGVVERNQGGELGAGVGGGGDEVVVGDAQGDVGCDDMENDARGDPREEVDDDQGIYVETAPSLVDGSNARCEAGQGSDLDDKMMEDPSFPTEEPAPERELPRPSAEEPAPGREPTLVYPFGAAPVPEPDQMLAMEEGMDCEDLPAIAAVDESAYQTESETETLDGDAEMGDDTMVYGLDDGGGEKRVDDEDKDEEEEVDELASEEESDLNKAAETRSDELLLNLLFGSEGMRAYERYCRLCL